MGRYILRDDKGAPIVFAIKGDEPSATEMERIETRMRERTQPAAVVTPDVEEEPGVVESLGSGLARGWNRTQAAADFFMQSVNEGLGNTEKAKEWDEAARAQVAEAESYPSRKRSFTDEDTISGKIANLAGTAGESAAGILPAIGGAVLGAPAGPAGIIAGFGAGSAIGSVPQLLSANAERQIEQHGYVKDWGKAYTATGLGAALEGLTGTALGKIAGIGGLAGKALLSKPVQEGVETGIKKAMSTAAGRVGAAGAFNAVSGALEETIQQGAERWQAEMALLDEDAKKEYIESAIVGGILEGLFGAGAGYVGHRQNLKAEKSRKDAELYHANRVAEAKARTSANYPAHQAIRDAKYEDPPPPPASEEERAKAAAVEKEEQKKRLRLPDYSAATREQKALEKEETKLPPGLQGDVAQGETSPQFTMPLPREFPAFEGPRSLKNRSFMKALTGYGRALRDRGTAPKPDDPFRLEATAIMRDTHEAEARKREPELPVQGPVKPIYSETEYRDAIDKLRAFKSVSVDRVVKEMKVPRDKAQAIFNEMLRRNDAYPGGGQNQYARITVPKGMNTRTGSETRGEFDPLVSRDYIVKPVQPANTQPFSIEVNGKKLGNKRNGLVFTTREDAQAYIDTRVPAGKKGQATVIEDTTAQQFGVYQQTYRRTKNGEDMLVGESVENTFHTREQAEEAVKELDPAYSPQTNRKRVKTPVAEKEAAAKHDLAAELGPLEHQLQNALNAKIGEGRAQVDLVPKIDPAYLRKTFPDAPDSQLRLGEDDAPVIEGFHRRDPRAVIKDIITLGADLNSPSLSEEERTRLIEEVLNHELIHVLRSLDLLTPKEWNQFYHAALNKKVPGQSFTWAQLASVAYRGQETGTIMEEAIAEMFRAYVKDPTAFRDPERGLLKKLADFIKKLIGLGKRHDAEDLMDLIQSGGIADRDVGHGGLGDRPGHGQDDLHFSLMAPDNFYLDSMRFLDRMRPDQTGSKQSWIKLMQTPSIGVSEDELKWLQIIPWLQSLPVETGVDGKAKPIHINELKNYIKASSPKVSVTVKSSATHPQFGEYRLEQPKWGGKQLIPEDKARNYAEVIFTVPPKKGEPWFQGGVHATTWGSDIETKAGTHGAETIAIPNVLAFARIRDVWKGAKKYLFIEEMQSDLHQRGSMNGYYSKSAKDRIEALKQKIKAEEVREADIDEKRRILSRQVLDFNAELDSNMMWRRQPHMDAREEQLMRKKVFELNDQLAVLDKERAELNKGLRTLIKTKNRAIDSQYIPNAPFKTNWEDYIIRRMIRHAAEHNYAGVAWHGSPESVGKTENYGPIFKERDQNGRITYRHNGMSVTPIINRYMRTLPDVVRPMAEAFGAEFQHNKVDKRPVELFGGYGSADIADYALAERWKTVQDLSFDLDDFKRITGLEAVFQSSEDRIEANVARNMMEKVLQAGRNQRRFDAPSAIDRVGVSNDTLLQFIRTVETKDYYGTKDMGVGDEIPFTQDHYLLDINMDMKEAFERGEQPFFTKQDKSKPNPRFSMLAESRKEIEANPRFQHWFTGSVVTEEDGSPKVMYHGTRVDQPFGRFRRLSHFGTADAAEDLMENKFGGPYASGESIGKMLGMHPNDIERWWGNLEQDQRDGWVKEYYRRRETQLTGSQVYPVFLSIRRPLIIQDDGSHHNAFSYGLEMKKAGVLSDGEFNRIMALRTDAVNNYTEAGEQEALSQIVSAMERAGYDGFSYYNIGEDRGSLSYVALREGQVKSIFNRGTWDANNPDISYSILQERGADLQANNDNFKKWFAKSRVVNDDGTPRLIFHGTVSDFDTFDQALAGKATDHPTAGLGTFFTDDPVIANDFAGVFLIGGQWPPKIGYKRGANVIPAFLSLQNPYTIRGRTFMEFVRRNRRSEVPEIRERGLASVANLRRKLIEEGYDGIRILKDASLADVMGGDEYGADAWVAFKPGQIKSALAEEFSTEDDSFKFSMLAAPKYSANAAMGTRVPPTTPIGVLSGIHDKILYDNASQVLHRILDFVPGSRVRAVSKEFVDDTFITLQDRMLSVGRLIDRMKKNGGFITNENDTYLRDTLFSGQTDAQLTYAERVFYNPLRDAIKGLTATRGDYDEAIRYFGNGSNVDRLLKTYPENVKLAFTELYAYAQHAQERNAEMRRRNAVFEKDSKGKIKLDYAGNPIPVRPEAYEAGSGLGDFEAQQILDWLSKKSFWKKLSDETNPNSVRSRIRDIVTYTNDVRVAAGLNPDFRKMKMTDGRPADPYKDYITLRGILAEGYLDDDDAKSFAKTGMGFNIRGREDYTAIGRTKSLGRDLVANLIMQNQEAIVRANKNKVARSFWQLIQDNPAEMASVAEILHTPKTEWGFDRGRGVIRQKNVDHKLMTDPSILKLKIDGDQVFIKISNERIAKAMNSKTGLGNTGLSGLIKFLLGVNRFLASMRTSYNPEFVISNFFRDLGGAMANLTEYEKKGIRRKVMKSVIPSLRGIRKVLRNEDRTSEMSKNFEEFKEYGGMTAFYGIRELEDTIHRIRKDFGEDFSGAPGKMLKAAKSLKKFADDYNLVVENGTRLAAYATLRDEYLSRSGNPNDPAVQKMAKEMAAQAAKNLTVNFNMGGEGKTIINALYLFYNASLQGSMALLNPLIRSRKMKALWAGVIVAGATQDMLMSMLSGEDDDGENIYDKIPAHVLEHNFVFMDPFGISERGYFKFPQPYLMNSLYNMGRMLSKTARGKADLGQLMESGGGTLVESLNPFGGSNSFLNWVAPSVIDPFVDLIQNEDFTGTPVAPNVSPYDKAPENRSQQYWANTNPAFISVADFLSNITGRKGDYIPGVIEMSPNQVEYVWDFMLGGVGPFLARAGWLASGAAQGEMPEEMSAADVPFVRKVYGSVTERNDQQAFYEGRDKVLQIRKAMQDARKDGNSELYLEIMRTYPDEYKAAARINKLENARKKISTQIKKIRENDNLSDEEKKKRIKAKKDKQNELIGTGNEVLENAGID